MRVGYVVDRFPSASRGFVLQEILALESRGIEVHPLSLDRPDGRIEDVAPALAQLRGSVDYFPEDGCADDCEGASESQVEWAASVAAARGLDHVHAHGSGAPADVARGVARLNGLGFSVTAHGDRPEDDRTARSFREMVQASAFVVTLTEFDRERLLQACGRGIIDKLHRIHMGVDPDEHQFAGSQSRDADAILAVGPLVEASGFTDLIAAVGMLRNRGRKARLTIVGEGPFEEALRASIDRAELNAQVKLVGEVSRADLAVLMRMHTALALPSVADDGGREALANTVLEAMAIGLPVLSTDLPGINELIADGMSGRVITRRDPRWLAGALETLFDNPELCAQMARRARTAVERQFTAARNVPRLAQLFAEAVTRRRLAPRAVR